MPDTQRRASTTSEVVHTDPVRPAGSGRSRLLLRALALALTVLILILLLGPATSIEQSQPGFDKVAHFVAFSLLLWSGGVLFSRTRRVTLAVVAVAMGGGSELLQGLVGRDADWLDFLADTAGVAVTLTVWAAWRGFRPRQARANPPTQL